MRNVVNKRSAAGGQMLFYGLLLIAFCLLTFLTSCTSVDPVVKVGLVAPFEGRERAIGYDVIYSARLAVREINAAGGIAGYRVSLVALDDSGDRELAAQTAASLVIDPQVVAVVGHWLPETTAVATPMYDAAGLTWLAGGAPVAADNLPASFVDSYTAVTPFDEQPGPYAMPAYASFQELWRILALAHEKNGVIDRISVQNTISGLE